MSNANYSDRLIYGILSRRSGAQFVYFQSTLICRHRSRGDISNKNKIANAFVYIGHITVLQKDN